MSIKLGVRYEGNGYFRAVARHGLEEAESKIKRGELMNAELRRPRSTSQNNLFHALCEVAFDNQRDGPQFDNWRQLKSWLLIRAGACTEWRFPAGSMTAGVAQLLRQQFDTVEIVRDRDTEEIVMRFVKSTSFDAMEHEEFTAIFDKCIDTICKRIVPGVEREQMIEMAKKGTA